MDSCHSLQCESQRENLQRRRIGPRNHPPKDHGLGKNPRPTFEIEKRTKKETRRENKEWNQKLARHYLNLGKKWKKSGKPVMEEK